MLEGAVGTIRKADPNWCPSGTSDWGAAAGLFGWFDTGFTNTYAAGQLFKAYSDKKVTLSDFTMQDMAFAVGLEGAVISAAQLSLGCNVALAISGLALGGASVAFDLYSVAQDKIKGITGSERTMYLVIIGMDAVVFGTNIAELTA
jgi:hypothetical protein